MNRDLLVKLGKKASNRQTLHTSSFVDWEVLEKFVELIVQECFHAAYKEGQWYFDKEEYQSADAIFFAARRIKEKFGIK